MADVHSRAGERYASAEIRTYLDRLHAAHDGPLALAFQAPEREGMPAIQVGPSEGKLLGLLIALTGARRVVEVGTLAGYSALASPGRCPPGASCGPSSAIPGTPRWPGRPSRQPD